tara:strand:- start:1413 stop:1847 length:435 start_codon:yes stop_codon:yes gene_type:complete
MIWRNKMARFTIRDTQQVLIGAFVASIFFFVIRAGNPFNITMNMGILITIFVILLSNPKPRSKNLNIFATEIALTYVVISFLSIGFGLADLNTATFGLLDGNGFNLKVFTTPVIVGFWLALPVAVVFNKENQDSYLARIFTRRR